MLRSDTQTVVLSGDINIFLLTGEQTAKALAQWEAHIPPGGGPPLHVHSREDESFYVIKGTIQCQVGETHFAASAGECVFLPRGVPHRFRNESSDPARVLITVQPAGLERMFLEVGTPVIPGAPSPVVDRGAERARLLASAEQYGMQYFIQATEESKA